MNKLFAILLCVAMLFAMTSCGNTVDKTASDSTSDVVETEGIADTVSEVVSDETEDTRTPVKIMPLGDSMTEGSRYDSCGGYRVPLLDMLDEDDVPYEFVGLYDTCSQNITNGQVYHSGQDGATVFSIDKSLPKMINLDPDIILVMVGRGESIDGINGEEFIAYFDKYVVKKLIKYFPDAVIYVASIPPVRAYAGPKEMDERDVAQTVTNPLIKSLIEAKKAEGSNIEWVEMNLETTGLVWEDFTVDDNVNPLPSGNEKLAAVWYNAIKDKIAEISDDINA